MVQIARILAIALVLGAAGTAAPLLAGDRNARPDYETLKKGPYYLQLEPIMVPRLENNVPRQLLTYVLVVEFADAESRERAKLIMPRLMDAFLRDLHILTSRPGTSEDGVDLAVAKRYLLASGERILGAQAVKDVLIERTISRRTG